MLGCRSSGLRPAPSCGTAAPANVSNGEALKTSSPQKKVAKPSSTPVAIGVTSRIRLRDRNRTRLDHSASSHAHNSNDPSCDDHAAAGVYEGRDVLDECVCTPEKEKSLRRKATSSTAKAMV